MDEQTPQAPAQEPVQEITPNETPVQEQSAPEAPADQAAPAEVAPAPQVEEVDEDPIPSFNFPQYAAPAAAPAQQASQPPQPPQTVPTLDPSSFTDQYGNVDMGKFAQAMSDRDRQLAENVAQTVLRQAAETLLPQTQALTAQQLAFARQEERSWQKVEAKYPQIKENRELRDLVHNTRMNYVGKGSQLSPVQAADKLFKYIGAAKQQGAQEASETVRVQASAHLESADNTQSESQTRTREVQAQAFSGQRNKQTQDARVDLLRQMMADGRLQVTQQ